MKSDLIKIIFTSLRVLAVLSILTGVLYPATITFIAQISFPNQANGSLIHSSQGVIGSQLIAQNFESLRYFSPRPSAADYNTLPSGASNLSQTSQTLKIALEERGKKWNDNMPSDLLTASASGLDPHISPQAALLQVNLVAKSRALSENQRDQLIQLIQDKIESPQFKIIGEPRVNVLELNVLLDQHFP